MQSSRSSQRSTSSAGTASAALPLPKTPLSTSRSAPPLLLPSSSSPAHLVPSLQFFEYNEAPLLLLLAPPSSGITGKELPVTVYESTVELVDDKPEPVFVPTPYEIETGEAERVAVDHVSKPMDGGEGGAQSSRAFSSFLRFPCPSTFVDLHSAPRAVLAALSTQRSALSMLHDRISLIHRYLLSLTAGTAPRDPETLRQIAALVASLPSTTAGGPVANGGKKEAEGGSSEFEKEFLTEYNDVVLTNYLAALTKQLLTANEVRFPTPFSLSLPFLPFPIPILLICLPPPPSQLFDKQLLLVTSSSSGGGSGGGDGRASGGRSGGGRRGAGSKHTAYD